MKETNSFYLMQLIRPVDIDAEQYAVENYHFQLRPPSRCPHCKRQRSLWALGYYVRYLSRLRSGVLQLTIRRFRCRYCSKTVSLLPAFAHPYRLIQNQTFHRFVTGQRQQPDVVRWTDMLEKYWRQFVRWTPQIHHSTERSWGRSPPSTRPDLWWHRLLERCGDPDKATVYLVEEFQITFFNRYQCHQPNPPNLVE